ncbi:MAG: hypothetical protein QOH67_4052 [Hyphomicrobiales bacterium]|jgi:hypothetical protein|nr:hypothetical protein [Hyphomicrobiales bacterium]
MKKTGFSKWRVSVVGVGLLLAVGFASPAAAQRPDEMKTGQGGGGHPCAGDAQSICSEFIPDRGKVASCLFKNKAKLSSACRTELGGGTTKVGKSRKGKRHGRRHRRR